MIPQVVASERGRAQTDVVEAMSGLREYHKATMEVTGMHWKVQPKRVTAPYRKPKLREIPPE